MRTDTSIYTQVYIYTYAYKSCYPWSTNTIYHSALTNTSAQIPWHSFTKEVHRNAQNLLINWHCFTKENPDQLWSWNKFEFIPLNHQFQCQNKHFESLWNRFQNRLHIIWSTLTKEYSNTCSQQQSSSNTIRVQNRLDGISNTLTKNVDSVDKNGDYKWDHSTTTLLHLFPTARRTQGIGYQCVWKSSIPCPFLSSHWRFDLINALQLID